ncbi:MAG TPA: hypothetical protein VED43_11570, partial [Mycobacterium sp.]|nr:hypothetical protein [Mycobacterium sp.]
ATMLFIHELARRGVRAYAANPGGADTDITRHATGLVGWLRDHRPAPLAWATQSPPDAARSIIQAVATELPGGTYIAPRFKQLGKPKVTKPHKKARDTAMACQLWDLSAELTGCDWTPHPTARAEVKSGESAAGYFENRETEL